MDIDRELAGAVRLHHGGRLREAAAVYHRVLSMRPEHPSALSGLGMIAFQTKRYDPAIALLERALAASGEHAGFLMNLGAIHDEAGNHQQAETCYLRAVSTAPSYPDPYYNLGALYLRQERPQQAVQLFDDCMAAVGRDFHALAYKAHALADCGRHEESRWLLDHERYVRAVAFDTPKGYADMASFSKALAEHIRRHPTLQANVMSTVNGKHTGELLCEPKGPMAAMEPQIARAVSAYLAELPKDGEHPVVKWAPESWKLTSWGVVMSDGGHERSHIHPNGWISGVFYLRLPDLIHDPARGHQGWLRFGRPTPELHVRSRPQLEDYQPHYGVMILFPSYFYHGTVPFRSRQRRVCVSFDVEPCPA